MTGLDLVPLIKSLGYFGIFTAILLENGIPLLFFVPGDTLLLTAGFLASQGYLDIDTLIIGGFITAILGYMLGYHLGHHTGLRIFNKGKSRFVKREHLEKTREFYKKYGNISLLLARFLPLRAWVCFLAGMIQMPYRIFMFYNVLGALAWGVFLPLIGYHFGRLIPVDDIRKVTLIPIASVVCMLIVVPAGIHFYRKRKAKSENAE